MFYLFAIFMHHCTVEVKDQEKYKSHAWSEKLGYYINPHQYKRIHRLSDSNINNRLLNTYYLLPIDNV